MADSKNDLFDSIYNYVKGTPMAFLTWVLSGAILLFGCVMFYEDVLSTYYGVQQIETYFNIRAASTNITYWVISGILQAASIVSALLYMSNRERYWYSMWIVIGAQGLDVMSDVW